MRISKKAKRSLAFIPILAVRFLVLWSMMCGLLVAVLFFISYHGAHAFCESADKECISSLFIGRHFANHPIVAAIMMLAIGVAFIGICVAGVWFPKFDMTNHGSKSLSAKGFLRINRTGLHLNTGHDIASEEPDDVVADIESGLKNLKENGYKGYAKVMACTHHAHHARKYGLRPALAREHRFLVLLQLFVTELAAIPIAAVHYRRYGKIRPFGFPRAYVLDLKHSE